MKQGLEGYYRLHAGIYDMTRWSFLFGRHRIISLLAETGSARQILEVGCGTGKNLVYFAKTFPHAHITGLDLSRDMIEQARKKTIDFQEQITLVQQPYTEPIQPGNFDIVLFSYSLTMMPDEWQTAVSSAAADLSPKGRIAVVDFHDTPVPAFRSWMAINHVRMQGHLLPGLKDLFTRQYTRLHTGYMGLWRYFVFIGATDGCRR